MAVVREFPRTTSTRSSSTIVLNQSPVLTASEGARPPPGLKLGAPLTQPPLGYALKPEPIPTLTGRSLCAAIAAIGCCWTTGLCAVAAATTAAATALFAAGIGVPSEVRCYNSRAYVPCMYMHPIAD